MSKFINKDFKVTELQDYRLPLNTIYKYIYIIFKKYDNDKE